MKMTSFAVAAVLFAIPSAAIAQDTGLPTGLPFGAKNILKAYDSNKNKELSGGELSAAGEKNMADLLERYDKNTDGRITLPELGLTNDDLKEKAEPKKKSGGKKNGKKSGKKPGKKGKKHKR